MGGRLSTPTPPHAARFFFAVVAWVAPQVRDLDDDEELAGAHPLLGQIDVAHATPAKGRQQDIAAKIPRETFDDLQHAATIAQGLRSWPRATRSVARGFTTLRSRGMPRAMGSVAWSASSAS